MSGARRGGLCRSSRWAALFVGALSMIGCKGAREAGDAGAPAIAAEAPKADARIVAVGGAVTEIVFALGLGDRVVAVDTSSTYPPDRVSGLAKVGYQRTLAAEGIVAQRPSLLLFSTDAGPPSTIDQLRAMSTPLHLVPGEPNAEGVRAKIRLVAGALGAEARGEALVSELDAELREAEALVRRAEKRPKVLFVYARGGGTMMVSGTKTPADAMIRLAGGENAITTFESFKPLTAEAVATAAPDILLIPALGLEAIGGKAALLAQPGVSASPAGREGRVIAMDDLLLLGFGPRLGRAVRELALAIHPELAGEKR